MGVAQGMDIFIELAESLKNKQDLGFIFVGRGSEVNKLKNSSIKKKLDNILFFDEISSDEIQNLLKTFILKMKNYLITKKNLKIQ